ncbi:MAG: hypothetical protein KDB53_00305, partial [Planctomycetes bacterium]|nr:hypothetical protein [Planctomycetota bacterium]
GRCEFLVVYGGLELGLGLIFALAAYRSSMELPVLWMAFVMHAALALYRVIIILTASGFATVIFAVFGLELALAIAGACLALPRGLP